MNLTRYGLSYRVSLPIYIYSNDRKICKRAISCVPKCGYITSFEISFFSILKCGSHHEEISYHVIFKTTSPINRTMLRDHNSDIDFFYLITSTVNS